jgi:flagellar motility protein MotE (MotC chaperone)
VADAKEAAPAAKPAAKAEVPDGQKSSAGASEAKAGAPKSDAKTPEGAGGGLTALLSGPGFSKGVDAILVEVQSREVELARRELELAEREVAVQELESMVAERAGELEKIRAEVENRILAWTSYGQDRIAQLSGVYSAMPPADAAQLLGKLDLDLAVSVIRQMKKKVSASILAAMNPDRALLVSRRILQPLDPSTDAPPARPY